MGTKKLDPDDAVLVGELTVHFVIAAKMTNAEITPDSDIANGIRTVLRVLSRK